MKREPFSFVRLGDGEGIILGYPQFTSKDKMNQRLDKWFGSKHMTEVEKCWFATELRTAAQKATILGLPQPRHININQEWRNVARFCDAFHLITAQTLVGSMDWVLDMHAHNKYCEILRAAHRIVLITCRNIAGRLQSEYRIACPIITHHIPPQNRPFVGPCLSSEKHYPIRFNLILQSLQSTVTPGTLVLVGAGGLGKIYCEETRKLGGVALDIGSMFDAWLDLPTRSHIRKAGGKYKL